MIIVITSPNDLPEEEEIANRLFENGLHALHLRKPGAPRERSRDVFWASNASPSCGNVTSAVDLPAEKDPPGSVYLHERRGVYGA